MFSGFGRVHHLASFRKFAVAPTPTISRNRTWAQNHGSVSHGFALSPVFLLMAASCFPTRFCPLSFALGIRFSQSGAVYRDLPITSRENDYFLEFCIGPVAAVRAPRAFGDDRRLWARLNS